MCGVAGAIGAIDERISNAIKTINKLQAHRGPDGEGYWQKNSLSGHGVALAHRRLAIIDLNTHANQPMLDSITGNALVFNGEIYNYKILRDELSSLGVMFSTDSDTEVILKAYGYWGKSFVSRLRGMFAIVIWDANTGQTHLYRDRMGIKPLYYSETKNESGQACIVFASEIKSLIHAGLVNRKLNPIAVESFVWNGFVACGEQTIVKDVLMVQPGWQLTIDRQGSVIEASPYWQYPQVSDNHETSIEELRVELKASMQQHLASDVPLGVFLSGGVDSSAMAALAVSQGHEKVSTYNLAFEEAEFSEAGYARKISSILGTEHHEMVLTQSHFFDELENAMLSMEQPTFDGINTYFISKEVRDAGVKVALAGTGGDELFGGYKSFYDVPKVIKASKALGVLSRPLLSSVSTLLTKGINIIKGPVPPQTRWGKAADLILLSGNTLQSFQTNYALFTQDYYQKLLKNKATESSFGVECTLFDSLSGVVADQPELCQISALEMQFFIKERLMRDTDAASMAASIEVRVPLLDHTLIEKVSHLNPEVRYSPLLKKQLLRDLAMPNIPPSLFDRPKSGFVLPFDKWCKDALQSDMNEVFMDTRLCDSVGLDQQAVYNLYQAFLQNAPGIYWSRIWSLYCLLWWSRQYAMTL